MGIQWAGLLVQNFIVLLYFSNRIIFISCYIDPGIELMKCVDDGEDIDQCAFKTFDVMRTVMEVGVPELGIPVLEPVHLGVIDFKFYNLTVKFLDINMKGFKTFQLQKSRLNKDKRTWEVSALLPTMAASGTYQMYGTIPPNIDLGHSAGDQRFSADKVFVNCTLILNTNPTGDGVIVQDILINVDLEGINLEMECLFPRNGKCCPKKYLKSCNTILTKTILRFINTDGRRFVKDFQKEISEKVKYIIIDHLNNAISSVKAKYLVT